MCAKAGKCHFGEDENITAEGLCHFAKYRHQQELGGSWGIWENNKNDSVSESWAQSLEQSEEMRSEPRPGEGLGRYFQKKPGDIPAFVLIRSHLKEKLNTPVSRGKPLREPLLGEETLGRLENCRLRGNLFNTALK